MVVVDSWFANGGYIARAAYRVGMLLTMLKHVWLGKIDDIFN